MYYLYLFRLHRILHLLENSVVVKGSKQKDLQVSLSLFEEGREFLKFIGMRLCNVIIVDLF